MKKAVLVSLILLIFPLGVFAYEICPFGFVNDAYPGYCARYVDNNNNGFCDLSQNEAGNNSLAPSVNYYFWQILILVLLFYGFLKYLVLLSKETNIFWLKSLTPQRVRRFLNYLLLFAFLLSLITGFVILFNLLGWLKIQPGWLYWHTEFSLIFAILALVHILERWRDFINRFKK